MDDIVLVEVVDGFQDLSYGGRSVLLGEATLFADAVKQLSTSRKLCHNVVFVLRPDQLVLQYVPTLVYLTLDSNQSKNLTMWGC